MWIEKIKEYSKYSRYINIKPSATDDEIQKLISSLGEIPNELIALLKELNGDDNVLFSVDQIITYNTDLRKLSFYMPLDCLLFFAGNGCGDYYGYQIRKEGITSNIFLWDHEYDNRTWLAQGIDEFITKYCNNQI